MWTWIIGYVLIGVLSIVAARTTLKGECRDTFDVIFLSIFMLCCWPVLAFFVLRKGDIDRAT